MTPIGFAVEGTLAVLLILAIIYCWRLDQRLTALRKGNDGMIAAARELSETIAQAELTIKQMRGSADEVGRDLQRRINEAKSTARTLTNAGRRSY